MTKEEIMEAIESMESIDSKEFDSGRIFDLYNVEIDGIKVSVIDSYEYGKERITLTLKDGTLILKSLDDVENVELVDVSALVE